MFYWIKIVNAPNNHEIFMDEFPYPLQKFDWTYSIVGDDVPKPFSAGNYDTRKNVGPMTIDMEGEIVESSTTAYWSRRQALLQDVVPNHDQPAGTTRHSQLIIKLDNWGGSGGQQFSADVQLSSFSIPIAAKGSPTISPFMFSWTCNAGYWTNTSTGILTRL